MLPILRDGLGGPPQDEVVKLKRAGWHGYQALGLRELERITGLNQFAIRTEFGGKEGLYLKALEFYTDKAIEHAMQPMRSGGIAEITAFLKALVADGSMTSSKYGCLIVNTGIENARVGSDRLDQAVRRYWDELEACFVVCLQNALSAKVIDPAVDPEAVAKGLVSGVMDRRQ